MSYSTGTVKFGAGAPKEKIATFAYHYSKLKPQLMLKVRDIAFQAMTLLTTPVCIGISLIKFKKVLIVSQAIGGSIAAPSIAFAWLAFWATLWIYTAYNLYKNYQYINNLL